MLKPILLEDRESVLTMMQEFYTNFEYDFDWETITHLFDEMHVDPSKGVVYGIFSAELIGYVILVFGFSFDYGGRECFIEEIFLKPEFRGTGIGSKVLGEIEQIIREQGFKSVRLEVEHSNPRARKLYEQLGFAETKGSILVRTL